MDDQNFQCSHLTTVDATLVGLYMNACVDQWANLPPLARQFYAAGGTVEQLRGCLRHLIVLAGYGPCLAANLTLQKAKLLPHDTPAKIGGPPGDAFELVYTTVTNAVRRKVHSSDAVLGEWIRLHLYGDIYSSPGLDLRHKQLLMCARLAQANMGEQLFGHALAALRFGATREELEEAIALAFEIAPVKGIVAERIHADALKMLGMSVVKFEKDCGGVPEPSCPEPTIPDLSYLRIPELYLASDDHMVVGAGSVQEAGIAAPKAAVVPVVVPVVVAKEERKAIAEVKHEIEHDDDDAGVLFAWEEVDERNDSKTGSWKES